MMVKGCPFYERIQLLLMKQAELWSERRRLEAADELAGRPKVDRPPLPITKDAIKQALGDLAWERHQSKLMRLQRQHWNHPHMLASSADPHAYSAARWLTNLMPGVRQPCCNCRGLYGTSRYHVAVCMKSDQALASIYDARIHVQHLQDADNRIDAVAMQFTGGDILFPSEAAPDPSEPRIVKAVRAAKIDDSHRSTLRLLGFHLELIQARCLTPAAQDHIKAYIEYEDDADGITGDSSEDEALDDQVQAGA